MDCCNDAEQVCELFTMIDEAVTVPFATNVLGALPVTVTAIHLAVDDQLVAICTHDPIT